MGVTLSWAQLNLALVSYILVLQHFTRNKLLST